MWPALAETLGVQTGPNTPMSVAAYIEKNADVWNQIVAKYNLRSLKRGGRLVSMLEQPRQELISEYGIEASFQFTQVTTERLAKLAELVDKGALKVHVYKTFPLEQAVAALHRLEKESPRGKVVLKVV